MMRVTEHDFNNQSITVMLDGHIRARVVEADNERGYIDYYDVPKSIWDSKCFVHRIFGKVRIFVFEGA